MDPCRRRQITWILVVFLCVVCLDQATKTLVRRVVPLGGPRFEGRETTFFYVTHDQNRGLVFGAFRDRPYVVYAAPLAATLVLIYLFRHLDRESRAQALAYGLVAGGAIGNLIDRIRLGYVTDFLQFHFHFIPFDFPGKLYPAFNVADSGICVGVFLLILGWRKMDEPRAADTP